MNTAISTLSRLLSSRRRQAEDPDPADMGTCFGMEMTLQREARPLESEQLRAAAARGEAQAAAGEASAAGEVSAVSAVSAVSEKRGWRAWAARSMRKAPLAA